MVCLYSSQFVFTSLTERGGAPGGLCTVGQFVLPGGSIASDKMAAQEYRDKGAEGDHLRCQPQVPLPIRLRLLERAS